MIYKVEIVEGDRKGWSQIVREVHEQYGQELALETIRQLLGWQYYRYKRRDQDSFEVVRTYDCPENGNCEALVSVIHIKL